MQIGHIFSELGTGLRRNISMSISLIVTMFVSLTLVGFAIMVNAQTNKTEQLYGQTPAGAKLFEVTDAKDFSASYFVTLKDPNEFTGVEGQVTGMAGVSATKNLSEELEPLYKLLSWAWRWSLIVAGILIIAAILQVSNTIRLTAYARRREIGIMRLVGASTWHIQLPFVLEAVLAATISGLLACAALAAFVQFFVNGFILDSSLYTV